MLPRATTIPAGWFLMGCNNGQPDERPVHRVWLDAFAIAVCPVTNEDYARFVAATGHRPPPAWTDARFVDAEQPVVTVSWFEAIAYSQWLCDVSGSDWRLPTEAEREKAALGGIEGARYPGGDALPAPDDATLDRPGHVGLDRANGYGLHNMGDLVHEWCSDWYGATAYALPPTHNPTGPANGTRRVSRGGSWRHQVPVSRCAARSSLPPASTYADYGFRVVRGLAGDR
ncbi:MAG: SUMF1/EgtB/PvdO family nonheme iron enzyme [Planctomycetota bacterium]